MRTALRTRALRWAAAGVLLVSGGVAVRRILAGSAGSRLQVLEGRLRGGRATPAELVEVGESYLLRGEPLRAAELAFRARKADPGLPTSHNLLGIIYGRIGEKSKARWSFERAAELAPDLLSPRLNLARLDLEAGDAAQALARLEPARRLHSEDATVWLLTGKAYRVLEQSTSAHRAFGHAAELDPTLADAQAEIGTLFMAFDRPSMAVAPLERAYHLGDHSPATIGMLALALATRRTKPADLQRAEKLLKEISGPKTSFGWQARGLVLHHHGDYAGARAAFQRVLELDPRQERALYSIAETYRAEGNREETLRAMRRFDEVVKKRQRLTSLEARLKEARPRAALLRDYGRALLDAGRPAEAMRQFRAWRDLTPSNPEPERWLRRAASELKASSAAR